MTQRCASRTFNSKEAFISTAQHKTMINAEIKNLCSKKNDAKHFQNHIKESKELVSQMFVENAVDKESQTII